MDISETNVVERIARVLAGFSFSANAIGKESSAAEEVDGMWHAFIPDALGVLRTLREPDAAMAAAGDAEIWTLMVEAAIAQAEQTEEHAPPEHDSRYI